MDAVTVRRSAAADPVAAAGRLAGVDVTAAGAGLTGWARMDVAAFVGFARRGPLDTPVEIGDLAAFESVFGGPVRLAADRTGDARPDADGQGELVGYLHGAVASFFANGGRTCLVVRVAGRELDAKAGGSASAPPSRAVRAELPMCRTAARRVGGRPGGARLRAAWAGADGYGIRLLTGVLSRAIAVDDVRMDRDRVSFRLRSGALVPGDLVRLCFGSVVQPDGSEGASAVEVQAAVDRIDEVAGGAIVTTAAPFLLMPCPPGPEQDAMLDLTADLAPGLGPIPGTDGARAVRADPGRDRLTLPGGFPAGAVPQPGEVVGGRLADETAFLALVRDVRAADVRPAEGDTAPKPAATILGAQFWLTAGEPPDRPPDRVEVLTLELRTQVGEDAPVEVWTGLGCAPGHDRYVGDLPTDEARFGARQDASPVDRSLPRCPVAGPTDRPVIHPLGLPFPAGADSVDTPVTGAVDLVFTGAIDDGRCAAARDGLDAVTPETFLDPAVLEVPAANLRAAADDVRARRGETGRLRGLHALLDVDAVTLLAVPDAVHVGLRIAAQPGAVWEPPPANADAPPTPGRHHDPAGGRFVTVAPALAAPTLRAWPDAVGTVRLAWSEVDAVSVLEELAGGGPWSRAVEVFHGRGSSLALWGRSPGIYAYRVRHDATGASSPWSQPAGVSVAGPAAPGAEAVERADGLEAVHAAVLEFCAARGDVFAVLTTPATWPPDEVFRHAGRLRSAASRERVADHAALYHPWVRAVGGRTLPPDGAVLGQVADLAVHRGVWVTGANRALVGVLGASSVLGDAVRSAASQAGTNPLLQTPRGVLALSAVTLSADPDLGEITTRRLLGLLRRFAEQLGAELVFEVDDAVRRRAVRHTIEDQLSRWLARGAFAGTTPQDSYRVTVTGGDGTLVVEVGVAPSVPLRFLTVRLLGRADGTIAIEGV